MVRTDVASAEMVKLASNAFLATKISFINEIANVSEELGADVKEVARGMGLDDRIGPKFLQAGIGYGGSCLAGDETVLGATARAHHLLPLERLWRRLEDEEDDADVAEGVIEPADLEVLSWVPGSEAPALPAGARRYEPAVTRATCSRCARRWAGACAAPPTTPGWSQTAWTRRSR